MRRRVARPCRLRERRAIYFPVAGTVGARTIGANITHSSRGVESPTLELEETSDPKNEIWRLIDTGRSVYYRDLRKERPAGWGEERSGKFQTFISVGVRAKNVGYGLLTIDALEPSHFTAEDHSSMEVLAQFLAAAEALCTDPKVPTETTKTAAE